MNISIDKLGKLSLAILEHFVEDKLGKKFVDELRAPTDRTVAVVTALEQTQERFLKEFEDKIFSGNILSKVSEMSLSLLAQAVGKFYDHPTDPAFPKALHRLISTDFPYFPIDRVERGVAEYITILTEELMLADDTFRQNASALAVVRSEKWQKQLLDALRGYQPLVAPQVLTTLFTIPLPVQDFTGREVELEQLKLEFHRGAVITGISGGGGVGKTQLACKLADELKGDYPDARMSIDLLGTSETSLAPEEAMRRLLEPFYPDRKLPDDPNQLKGLYQQTFTTRKALLLLDNVASAKQVRPLIPPPPSAAIMTSRQHFSLTEFGLKEPLRLRALSLAEAQRLLRTTSEKIKQSPDKEVDKLVELCGYLPLALRVAASILNDRPDWTLETLLQQLADEHTRLQNLKRPDDTDFDVEATIGLSYRLLSDEDKKYFRILSVFAELFWIQPVIDILGLEHKDDVEKCLGALITRSLLNSYPVQFQHMYTNDTQSGNLYTFHDLTRLYASSRLYENTEEAKAAIERHAHLFLELGTFANDEYFTRNNVTGGLGLFREIWSDLFLAWQRMLPNQKYLPRLESADDWLVSFPVRCGKLLALLVSATQRIRIHQAGLEALKTRKVESSEAGKLIETDEIVVPLEVAYLNNLGETYISAGEMSKAISVLEDALAKLNADNSVSEKSRKYMRGSIFANMGNASYGMRDLEKAIEYWQQQLNMANDIHDLIGVASALGNVGNAYSDGGDFLLGTGYYQQQLNLARKIGARQSEEAALGNMGVTFGKWGEFHKSRKLHEQARDIARERGDIREEGTQVMSLGTCYADLGDLPKAIETYKDALVYSRMAGDRYGEANILVNLGTAYYALGEKHQATVSWQEALAIYQAIEHPRKQQVQDWLNRMDFDPRKITIPSLYLPELIQAVINAVHDKNPVAAKYFETVSKIINDPDITAEFRELISVLQKVLIGIKDPDLSKLPEELERLVRDELEKIM